MDLRVDHGVTWRREPTHAAALPPIDATPIRHPSLLDRVSDQFNDRWGLLAAGAGATGVGAAIATARAGSGVAGALRGGMLASIGGAALLVGGGVLFDVLTRRGMETESSAARAGAPVVSPDIRADESLRVMSFNIHGALGPGGEWAGNAADVERVARAIEREDPDVVLLQEVDDHAVQSGFRDVLGGLADRLDADGAVQAVSARTISGRRNGVGILTFNGVQVADARSIRSPNVDGEGTLTRMATAADTAADAAARLVADRTWKPFGTQPYRPRATADVLVTTPAGNAVRVLSGHWSWPEAGVDHPRRQIDPLAAILDAWDGPTIIGGDFNVKSATRDGDREAAAFAKAGLQDAFTQAGIPLADPRRRTYGSNPKPTGAIDRIYGSRELGVADVRVGSHVVDGIAASDHRPVIVDYELRGRR